MITKPMLLLIISLALPTMVRDARSAAKDHPSSSHGVRLSLVDKRAVILQDIDRHLLMRITKDDDSGWDVAVIRKPYRADASINLLYHSLSWHGPYPNQVGAWQLPADYFPNHRQLDVHGYRYQISIDLIDPVVVGSGSNARFISGTLMVSWKRTTSVNAPAEVAPGPPVNAKQTVPSYVLRAWEFDTDRGAYLWTLERESDSTSPKTLYRSLDSPILRAKVASLPPATRIVFDFRGGGSFQSTDEITGRGYKAFLEFTQFCKSKHLDFEFTMVTN